MNQAVDRVNPAKSVLREGGTVLGTIVNVASPALVEAVGWAGLDFVFLDSEHGPLGIETLENMVRAADVAGVPAVVRVPENDPGQILRCLDIGAAGIHVPQVSTAEAAERAVAAMKYWPDGARGLSFSHRAARYGLTPRDQYVRQANGFTMLAIHIEDREGVQNIDEILDVPGIDVAFLGTVDLSQSLGVPGQTDHPAVEGAVARVMEAAAKRSVAVGAVALSAEQARAFARNGIRYVVLSTAIRLLCAHLKDVRKQM